MKRSINLSLYSPDLNKFGIRDLEKVMKKVAKSLTIFFILVNYFQKLVCN